MALSLAAGVRQVTLRLRGCFYLDFPSHVSQPRLGRKTSGSAAIAKFSPCPSGLPVSPLRYALAASGRRVGTGPSQSGPNVTRGLRMHTWKNPRSFAFPLVEGFYRLSRNERPCWKSARLRGSVMLQLLSAPLQDGIGFLQRSVAPHLVSFPCG